MKGREVVYSCVLDASALIAFLRDEPGATVVAEFIHGAAMSSVNWSEVIQKTLARGLTTESLREDLAALGLSIEPLSARDAEQAALLWSRTRAAGLSLGDRSCLALGLRLGIAVLTADRAWDNLTLPLNVRLVR
ncbi:MAG: type II toxin-antitoxin system VapC family toxin [Deinococcota bacterium]|nr:type II toxin-antitoxin system VapC family toxin [Deinococcota bacterium]